MPDFIVLLKAVCSLKPVNRLLSRIFHVVFSDCGWHQVTEAKESQTFLKRRLLSSQGWGCSFTCTKPGIPSPALDKGTNKQTQPDNTHIADHCNLSLLQGSMILSAC